MSRAIPRPWSYNAGAQTDQSKLKMLEEAIREQVTESQLSSIKVTVYWQLFVRLRQELPYSLFQREGEWRLDANTNILTIDHKLLTKSRSQIVGSPFAFPVSGLILSLGDCGREAGLCHSRNHSSGGGSFDLHLVDMTRLENESFRFSGGFQSILDSK